jgi:CRP/FNR family cyclic AMP-dependent transcriptional regulator
LVVAVVDGKIGSDELPTGESMRKHLEAGDILFRQGEPSDHTVLLHAGRVDVLREVGAETILLGSATAGEFVGEMGVLDARPRSATVRAATAVEVELIERDAFIRRVSRDPELAHKLLLRMSARLRDVDDLLTRARTDRVRPEEGAAPSGLPEIELEAATFAAKFYVGVDPIRIIKLPFVVGREAGPHEAKGSLAVDLEIPEPEPYRLSVAHFALVADGGRVLLRDLDSELGTIVEGTALGRDLPTDRAALREGVNEVIAGGRGSPFAFTVRVGQPADAR